MKLSWRVPDKKERIKSQKTHRRKIGIVQKTKELGQFLAELNCIEAKLILIF